MKTFNVRSIISILLSTALFIIEAIYWNSSDKILSIAILSMAAWILFLSFPVKKKISGELQIDTNSEDKNIYRIVLYDDPESFTEETCINLVIIPLSRKKQR